MQGWNHWDKQQGNAQHIQTSGGVCGEHAGGKTTCTNSAAQITCICLKDINTGAGCYQNLLKLVCPGRHLRSSTRTPFRIYPFLFSHGLTPTHTNIYWGAGRKYSGQCPEQMPPLRRQNHYAMKKMSSSELIPIVRRTLEMPTRPEVMKRSLARERAALVSDSFYNTHVIVNESSVSSARIKQTSLAFSL